MEKNKNGYSEMDQKEQKELPLAQQCISRLLCPVSVTDCDMSGVKSAELVCAFSSRFSLWPQKCRHLPVDHQTHRLWAVPGL